ncbi:cytoplasmic protein [Chryseobacterium mucoviscidosis]|nr:cytoplasmic protein [Chryseobacterium mucoviscidosis]
MTETPRQFDYIGCLYPEGYINADYTYVFNHEDIEEIIFRGYADEEEEAFAVSLSES